MKIPKLLIAFLAVSILTVSCKKDNDDLGNDSTSKLKKIVWSEEGDDETETIKLNYGENGFVDKMTFEEKEENEVEQSITTFKYNAENQIIEETRKDDSDDDRITKYEYDGGKLVKSTRKSKYTNKLGCDNMQENCTRFELIKRTTTSTYEYNTKGFLAKETYTHSDYNVTTSEMEHEGSGHSILYKTDDKGNITKRYGEEYENQATTYTYSNNKNPVTTAFPKNYRVVMGMFANEYMQDTSKRTDEDWEAMQNSTDPSVSITATYSTKNKLTITDNKIVKATKTYYKNAVKDEDTEITEYFY